MKKIFLLVALCTFVFSACKSGADNEYVTNVITFTWKGTLSSSPKNPELGWAYYDSTMNASYYWDGSSWQIISKDGKNGEDGLSIVWKGELTSSPSSPQVNWAYYNRIDGNSYIWNGSNWDYLAKSGRDGAVGILLWLGAFETAPENPSMAGHIITKQMEYPIFIVMANGIFLRRMGVTA